jgi:DNA-binding helix-hairpin-helix protein with protein kinase domain
MNELLSPGQSVRTHYSGEPCVVERFLGAGGQGEVYRAKWSGGDYALKWYFPHTATREQNIALQRLIQDHPSPSDRFLWPLDLALASGVKGFGYLMRLREPRYRSLFDLVTQRIDPTYRALTTAAIQLVDSFHKLHADGLCYRDISFGNAFFDPDTGEVLICDNDNVAENRSPVTGVLGTPDFMAPELVRMEALPSRQTDLFSLAVLLFYMFCNSHPLVGKRILAIRSWDYPARKRMFGEQPLFIFDPADDSNAAVDRSLDPVGEAGDNALATWPLYPQFLRELFTKAFTAGVRDAEHGRVTEGEWKFTLGRLQDSLLACSCGKQGFFDPAQLDACGRYQKTCWNCGRVPPLPFRLHVGKLAIVLGDDMKLAAHHLDDHSDFEADDPLAEVTRHPTNPNARGLKNVSSGRWVATTADGTVKDVEPGKSIVLAAGTKIAFGRQTGEIRG